MVGIVWIGSPTRIWLLSILLLYNPRESAKSVSSAFYSAAFHFRSPAKRILIDTVADSLYTLRLPHVLNHCRIKASDWIQSIQIGNQVANRVGSQ